MIRSLFRFVAAVSLLLFVATLVLWFRGRQTVDHFWLIHGDKGSEMLRSGQGLLTVRHSRPNGRSRITMPQRVSHWACRVGSQLPAKPSPRHWQWRRLTYEGTPAATPGQVKAARADLAAAAAFRAEHGVSDAEWEAVRSRPRFVINPPVLPPEQAAWEQQIVAAKMAENRAWDLLTASSYWEWTFPAWLAAAVTAAPPAMLLLGRLRRRRVRLKGRCPDCGYDLRASGERCPECGLATGRKAPAAPTTGAAPAAGPARAPPEPDAGDALSRRYTA